MCQGRMAADEFTTRFVVQILACLCAFAIELYKYFDFKMVCFQVGSLDEQ